MRSGRMTQRMKMNPPSAFVDLVDTGTYQIPIQNSQQAEGTSKTASSIDLPLVHARNSIARSLRNGTVEPFRFFSFADLRIKNGTSPNDKSPTRNVRNSFNRNPVRMAVL